MTRTQLQLEEYRTGEACIEVHDASGRPCPGVSVWAEQESHEFVFGCVAPNLDSVSDDNQRRCQDRLRELFNHIVPAGSATESGLTRFDVPDGAHLGRLRPDLDRRSSAGEQLEVWVDGCPVGLGRHASERDSAEWVAALYTLCFGHPAVSAIIWEGFWESPTRTGGGLLRPDFSPKPAFRYLHKLIGTVWHSRARGETDAEGRFTFRGFFGNYRVGCVSDSETTTAVMTHRSDTDATVFSICPPCP